MDMKTLAADAATAVATGKSYLVAGVLGLGLEQATGYSGPVWIAMLIGAFVIRQHPDGAMGFRSISRAVWKGWTAVGVAWVGTGAVAAKFGITEEPFMVAIAALLAGISETILEYIRHPEKIISLWAQIKGVRSAK